MYQKHVTLENGSYQWLVLFIATFSQACASFVIFGMGPMAAFYQQYYSLSQFETGLIVSAVNIGPIFSMLIFGNLMDKYGEKWVVGLGAIFLGLNTLLAYSINSYMMLIINLFFVGIWYGTAQPGGSSAIVKWFPGKFRGLAMGIRQTGIPIGGAMASAVLPFFFYQYGLPSAILVQGITSMAGGFIFLILYKNLDIDKKEFAKYSFMEKMEQIKNNARLYPVLFIGLSMVSLQMVIVAHLMSFLASSFQMTLSAAGTFLSFSLVGGMCGRIILPWLSDTIFQGNRSKPLQLTIVIAAGTIFCLTFLPAHSPLWFIGIICFLLGFLGIGWYSLFIVLIAERSNQSFIGLTISFALTLNQILIVAAPALFGFLVDLFNSYNMPFLLLALFILSGAVWIKIAERSDS